MTMPRHSQLSLEDTPWYHCVSRCVRRAYLCGVDSVTDQSYEHRRDWVAQRIKQLAAVFTIDVAAYAVMSNHYHIVVRVDNERNYELSTEEVMNRWAQLYKGPVLINRYLSEQRSEMSESELFMVDELATVYRERLSDLSWFMKNLNEYIARKANKEDRVRGHFWESRFKCQSLLDEKALLAAMAYVDLNPVRAKIAELPEESEFTSIYERINDLHQNQPAEKAASSFEDNTKISLEMPTAQLMQFDHRAQTSTAIPFALYDYIELVDWVGRAVHPDKSGTIDEIAPPILRRIGIDPALFVQCACGIMDLFGVTVGSAENMAACSARRQVKFLHGMKAARQLLSAA